MSITEHWSLLIFINHCILTVNFAIQPVQMGLRSLLFDLVPPEQQIEINAWAARSALGGNVIGYSISSFDLPKYLGFIELARRVSA